VSPHGRFAVVTNIVLSLNTYSKESVGIVRSRTQARSLVFSSRKSGTGNEFMQLRGRWPETISELLF
jgi:hypothetical protein